jgi:hypothetical protein
MISESSSKAKKINPVKWFRDRHGFMFIWVRLVFEELEDIVFEDVEFDEILANPPQKITEIYQTKLERRASELDRRYLDWMKEIFRWVVMSKRDLTLSELARAVRISQGRYDPTKPKGSNVF